MYNPDKPIKSYEEDLLGRSDFAKQLAEAIITLSTTDNTYVVGLYGEWGTGKTSVLNLTEAVLREISGKDNNPGVTLVRFNPWGYTDGSQLIQQFFSVLSKEVQSDTRGKKREAIGDALEKYSFLLSYLKFIPVIGSFLTEVPELAEKIGINLKEGVLSNNNIQDQKKIVNKALASFQKKIIIFIDDIDRLPNEQIRMIFQLVNSVADFPNVIYVLSFDKNIVVRALKDVQNCIGEEYLKKIIQFPISLPELSGDAMFEILRVEINKVFIGTNQDLFEKEHWNNVLLKCVYPFISSIRDVRRYINTLYFKYTPLKNNINPADFAGITALEVFERQIFDWIIRNQEVLTTTIDDDPLYSTTAKEVKKENWYSTHKEKCLSSPETVLDAIAVLFPMYAARFDVPYEALDSSESNRQLRICSNQRFERYFTLSLGNTLLTLETRNLSYTKYDKQELATYLQEILKNELAYQYLQDTLISIKSIPEERKQLFIEIMFDNIGAFSKQQKDMLTYSPYALCLSLLSSLLRSIPNETTRLAFFQSLIEHSSETNLFASAQLIHHMEVALGRFGSTRSREDKIVFNSENIVSIEQSFIQRINTLPDQNRILQSEHLIFIDYLWKNIDVQNYSDRMKLLLSTQKNMLLYTANKAQRILSMFEGTISWTFDIERDFTNIISVSDILGVIASDEFRSLLEGLSLETTTKIAAFYLYTKDIQPSSMSSISNSDAEELAMNWVSKQ